jgi:hypothetical protein
LEKVVAKGANQKVQELKELAFYAQDLRPGKGKLV